MHAVLMALCEPRRRTQIGSHLSRRVHVRHALGAAAAPSLAASLHVVLKRRPARAAASAMAAVLSEVEKRLLWQDFEVEKMR